MHPAIKTILESKKWDKLIKDLDKNMAELDRQKEMSTKALVSFKQIQAKLQKAIDRSNKTIEMQKIKK